MRLKNPNFNGRQALKGPGLMWGKHEEEFDEITPSSHFWPILGLTFMLVCALTFNVLNLIKSQTNVELRTTLEAVLRTTHNGLKNWTVERKQDLEAIAKLPDLKTAARTLMNPPSSFSRKKRNSLESKLLNTLHPEMEREKQLGYLIISKEGNVLISSFGEEFSTHTLPERILNWLKPSFDGKTVVSPPVDPDGIDLEPSLDERILAPAVLITATPLLRNEDGVEAILAFVSSLEGDVSETLRSSRFGQTGETYALSKEGLFLSESRFQKQIMDIGLILPTKKEVLALVSLDPGGNLIKGFQPRLPREELPLTFAAAELAKGKTGFSLKGYCDYRGVSVVGAWVWDDDLQYGLVTQLDTSEAFATFYKTRRLIASLMLVTMLFFIVPSFLTRISYKRKIESEKGFEALFQESNDIVVLIDSSTYKFADANKMALESLGYSKEELRSLSLMDLHPGDKEETVEFIESVKKGQGQTGSLTCLTKNGKLIPVEVSAFPLKVMGKSFIVCSGRDTTERRKAQQALNEERAWLSTIINNTMDSIIVIDEKGLVKVFNPAAERITGYKKEEILGKNVNILVPEPHKNKHDEYIKRFLQTGENRIIGLGREVDVQKRSGAIFPAKLAVSLGSWENKLVFIGTLMDMTEQKKAQDIILQANESLERKVKKRTRELVNEKASMEVLRVVAEGANELGNADEATLLCLKKVCEFLHWEAGHAYKVSHLQKGSLAPTELFYLVGDDEQLETYKTQIHSVALIEGLCIPGQVLRDGDLKLFEDLGQTCTNCPRDELISGLGFKMGLGFPVLVGNEVTGVLEFFTQSGPKPSAKTLKTLGQLGMILGRAMERDRIDRMKTEFLSTAAHELRTPMTTIQGYSELMMKRELPKAKAERFLSMINKESIHLTHIVNDLLDVARIESGEGFVVSMEPGDISLLAKDEISSFRENYPNYRFEINVSGQPVTICFDRGKIRQVIRNLFSNAVKYSPKGGMILTRLEYSSEGVTCSILDEGKGMEPEQVKRIFERFYRVDDSGAIKGTGLGMAIVKHIIESHQGKIWVESELGKGSLVHFRIPKRPSGPTQESIRKSV